MRKLFVLTTLIFALLNAYSQWADNGNIYTTKKVGIGTSAPAAKLHVATDNHAAILLQNTGNVYDQSRARMGLYGSEHSKGLLIQNSSNSGATWTSSLFLTTDGRVGIKTTEPNSGAALTVNGTILTNALNVNGTTKAKRLEITSDVVVEGSALLKQLNITENVIINGTANVGDLRIQNTVPTSDYVFESDYKLMKLSDLEQFVTENKHLPEVPSAKEFTESGYNVGEMDDLLLRKIEELTLYILEQEKRHKEQENIIRQLQQDLRNLK